MHLYLLLRIVTACQIWLTIRVDGFGRFSFQGVESRLKGTEFKLNAPAGLNHEPLLLRTAKGEICDRVPVWMMRQAGRHMQAYRDICKRTKSFRERSENVEIATEISLQPWEAYGTDGCILFSDILTPLPGMGVNFDISDSDGPIMEKRWLSMSDIQSMTSFDPYKSLSYIGDILKNLRHEIGDRSTLLGFVGLPFTLASYMIEGGSSHEYREIKRMAYENPFVLHFLLNTLAENIANYAIFQIENGAQVIQVFDSWAGVLSPIDYDSFALPYQKHVIEKIKRTYPSVPIIMYIHKSAALVERMECSGADIISLDWTVSMDEAQMRLTNRVGVQGNLDPVVLLANKELIRQRTTDILLSAKNRPHIMNLGHGIDATTPEENVKYFVETVKNWHR